MGAEAKVVGPKQRWGTWEELILGGAVLRHGTQDWNVVASELRARTPYPFCFTPQACKAKYEGLRKRYSGSPAWFDELRKSRVAELKRELEKSEDSIGSLESKIEILKAKKRHSNKADRGSNRTESPAQVLRSDGNESFGKETSKDGLSASSFTQDTRTSWSLDHQIPALVSSGETDTKQELSVSFDRDKGLNTNMLVETNNREGGTLRKKRGKRKRKDCGGEGKEGSVGENDNLGSTDFVSNSLHKGTSASERDQNLKLCITGWHTKDPCQMRSDGLIGIFNSIAEYNVAFVFRHRLDSQRRARYKKIIRQHMDFDMIRSRLLSCSIHSVRELFRDLLLLANNALVFYSKRTREYKSAVTLRDIVLKAYQQHYKGSNNKATSACLPMRSLYNPPVKPRSVRRRPIQPKLSAKLDKADNIVPVTTSKVQSKSSDLDANVSLQSLLMAKKGLKRPIKIKNGLSKAQPKTPILKDRKGAQQS
ncbi:hypothetical protein ACH5RR_015049 [Cinchona calisaya]|uniref:Bromo domain-containing protein n=1 Tax=Cinchona calisaya TaxID=153742 RepID=A0ABD2ZS04_9GENT